MGKNKALIVAQILTFVRMKKSKTCDLVLPRNRLGPLLTPATCVNKLKNNSCLYFFVGL